MLSGTRVIVGSDDTYENLSFGALCFALRVCELLVGMVPRPFSVLNDVTHNWTSRRDIRQEVALAPR